MYNKLNNNINAEFYLDDEHYPKCSIKKIWTYQRGNQHP